MTDHEGIQPDFSYHRHGAQQQFGNYGLSLLVELSRLGGEAVPAGYVVTDAPRDALRGFALDGLQWTCWRGVMDVNACGRQLFPRSGQEKAHAFAAAVERLANLCPAGRPACDAAAHRDDPDAANDLPAASLWRRPAAGLRSTAVPLGEVRVAHCRLDPSTARLRRSAQGQGWRNTPT